LRRAGNGRNVCSFGVVAPEKWLCFCLPSRVGQRPTSVVRPEMEESPVCFLCFHDIPTRRLRLLRLQVSSMNGSLRGQLQAKYQSGNYLLTLISLHIRVDNKVLVLKYELQVIQAVK
jgi:hypothetical protein